jgi:hypothetical protein
MVWQVVPQNWGELLYSQPYVPPTSAMSTNTVKTMIESMLFQRGEPGGGKKKFLSPVLIFLNMLCLREMVEKYYLEFYRIFIGAPPVSWVELLNSKANQPLGSAEYHTIDMIWSEDREQNHNTAGTFAHAVL